MNTGYGKSVNMSSVVHLKSRAISVTETILNSFWLVKGFHRGVATSCCHTNTMKVNISDLHSFISKIHNLKHALQVSIAVNDENV
jgi:hypothetical protein